MIIYSMKIQKGGARSKKLTLIIPDVMLTISYAHLQFLLRFMPHVQIKGLNLLEKLHRGSKILQRNGRNKNECTLINWPCLWNFSRTCSIWLEIDVFMILRLKKMYGCHPEDRRSLCGSYGVS